MKRLLSLFIFAVIFTSFAFAKDVPVQTVKVTRQSPTGFLLDGGAILHIPISEENKGFGVFAAGTLTPIQLWKITAGFKGEVSIFANKDILHSGNKKKLLKFGFMGLFLANYPLAKSFEVYGGAGLQYTIKDFEEFNDFGQTWGAVIQGGGRGRVNDWFGVGLELDIILNLPQKGTDVDAKAYISFEI